MMSPDLSDRNFKGGSMRILPTLRQLRYLVALSEHRHFGRAAEACLVTQSTMSASLQELESLLNCSLVERGKRHVVLTPLGLQVVARAEQILRDAQDMVDAVSAASTPFSTPIRLGVIPTIAPFFLPHVLPKIRASYPDLHLLLHEDLSDRLAERLRLGELDALLLALPWPIDGVEELVLGDDPFLLAMPSRHPLAGRQKIPWDEINPDELLLMAEGHCLRNHALAACDRGGIGTKSEGKNDGSGLLGTSLHTIIQMVAGGLGTTLIPKMAVKNPAFFAPDLALAEIEDKTAGRQIGLVWRKTSPRGKELRILGGFFAKALSDNKTAKDPAKSTSSAKKEVSL